MNATKPIVAAIAVVLLSTPAFASETSIRRDCTFQPDGGGYTCTTTISRPPPPSEPFYRGPATREDIPIPPTIKTIRAEPTPTLRTDNFCGPGFHMTIDGCALNNHHK